MPIVKLVSRKDSDFFSLVEYLHKDHSSKKGSDKKEEIDGFTLLHNIFDVNPDDKQGMVSAFVKNNEHRKKRKNGVAMYHDIVSFHPKDAEFLRDHPEALDAMLEVLQESLDEENSI